MSADDFAPPPDTIRDLALACVASVKATLGIELDFTQDTLPLLDHYAREILEADKEEITQLTVPMCGAYFGEVIRRNLAAFRWHCPGDNHRLWRLELETAFLFFNPLGVAHEVALGEDIPGWWSHLEVAKADQEHVKEALSLFGDVRESDYYSFSLRYEVIDQVALSIARRAAQERDGDEEIAIIAPDLYAAFVTHREDATTH